MNKQVEALAEKAKRLPVAQRLELVDELLASLHKADPALDQLWGEEAEQRLKGYRQGHIDATDAGLVMGEMRRRKG